MEKLHNEGKGQRESKIRLVGKGGTRSRCVGCTPSMDEARSSKRVEREKSTFFWRENLRAFWLIIGLGKKEEEPTMLSLAWEKLELEALELWWSVDEGGEGDAFSSFHESYEEVFCESDNEK